MNKRIAPIALLALSIPITSWGQEAAPVRVSVSELFRALHQAKLNKKGEEEKTVDYEKRVSSFRFKGHGINSEFMTTFKPSQFKDLCLNTLDADSDEISFACTLKSETSEASGMVVPVRQSTPSFSSYTGVNAYNRQVKVSKINYSRDVLLLNTEANKFLKNDATFYVGPLKSRAGKLKSDYERIEIAVTFRLRAPFIDEMIGGTTPKIDDPRDITVRSNAIVGIPLRFQVFKDGEKTPFKTYDIKAHAVGYTDAFVEISFPEQSAEQ